MEEMFKDLIKEEQETKCEQVGCHEGNCNFCEQEFKIGDIVRVVWVDDCPYHYCNDCWWYDGVQEYTAKQEQLSKKSSYQGDVISTDEFIMVEKKYQQYQQYQQRRF